MTDLNEEKARTLTSGLTGYQGYFVGLEAERARSAKLVEALGNIRSVSLNPDLGQIVGSEHYEGAWLECVGIAVDALAAYRKAAKP